MGVITFIEAINCPEEDAYRNIKEAYQQLYTKFDPKIPYAMHVVNSSIGKNGTTPVFKK